jgi:hypothetical protein
MRIRNPELFLPSMFFIAIFYFFPDPNTFLLDHLLQLKPVKFLEGELIHDLLTIFVSQKLEAYTRFYESHKLVFIFLFFPIFYLFNLKKEKKKMYTLYVEP